MLVLLMVELKPLKVSFFIVCKCEIKVDGICVGFFFISLAHPLGVFSRECQSCRFLTGCSKRIDGRLSESFTSCSFISYPSTVLRSDLVFLIGLFIFLGCSCCFFVSL